MDLHGKLFSGFCGLIKIGEILGPIMLLGAQ
jgi:hypothetical protein